MKIRGSRSATNHILEKRMKEQPKTISNGTSEDNLASGIHRRDFIIRAGIAIAAFVLLPLASFRFSHPEPEKTGSVAEEQQQYQRTWCIPH
jgi:hypothetical protein